MRVWGWVGSFVGYSQELLVREGSRQEAMGVVSGCGRGKSAREGLESIEGPLRYLYGPAPLRKLFLRAWGGVAPGHDGQ